MFADDALIYLVGEDIDVLIKNMNEDMERIIQYMAES